MSNNELKKYHETIIDGWNFFKKWNAAESDEEWEILLHEAKELDEKDNTEFRRKFISLIVLEINRLAKERKSG